MLPSDKIYAYVPGLGGSEKSWKPLVDKLRADIGGQWVALEHHCGAFSRRSPMAVARSLSARLDSIDRQSGGEKELVLIGHSIGGLLIRTAYLIAAGKFGEGEAVYDWPRRVSRFVLMASMDRGVNPEGSMRAKLGTPFARFLRPVGIRLIYDILKGSTFVTNLRIAWMRYYRTLPNPPMVVQVRGTKDDEVARNDTIDPDLFPHAVPIDVPEANHVKLHDLTGTPDPETHYECIRHAIADDFPRHAAGAQIAEKSRVIFLLHGIRASKLGWPTQLKNEILRRDPSAIVELPDYGYFSALRFAIPYFHRKPLRWFQDEYSQALARHPGAEFYFVGHSNGTYLMAQSLREIGGMIFNRIFLGGCVLSPAYVWPSRPQPYVVHNAYAYTDKVVGILCSALAGLGRKDVGTAGFESFREIPDGDQNLVDRGHGAAFDSPADLETVADFILTGARPPAGAPQDMPSGIRRLSRFSTILGWLVLAILVVLPIWGACQGHLLATVIADLTLIALIVTILILL